MTEHVTWFVDAESDPLDNPFESRLKHLLGQCSLCGRAVEHLIQKNPFGYLVVGLWIPPSDGEAQEIRAKRDAEIARYRELKESVGECECGHDFDEERFW